MVKKGKLYILAGGLKKELLQETYDAKWIGYPGEEMTLALLAISYYWTKMDEDIQAYVNSYLVYHMNKIERKKVAGLLNSREALGKHLY